MPIYEFTCKECGKDSELLIRSSDWKREKCPKCGSTKLMKKLSVFAAGKSDAHTSACDVGSSCMGNPGGPCCGGGVCGLS